MLGLKNMRTQASSRLLRRHRRRCKEGAQECPRDNLSPLLPVWLGLIGIISRHVFPWWRSIASHVRDYPVAVAVDCHRLFHGEAAVEEGGGRKAAAIYNRYCWME